MKRFALVGNPNSGKTTLFNTLTGSTARVGNWPGVTVDKKVGTYKKCEEVIEIVDLPGIYSLSPYTPEEVISRNFIIDEKPECVINIVDATNLERNLYLTTQLLEMDVPVIVALNMMDVVEKNGDKIDTVILERQIGVPVVAISAQTGSGIEDLMNRAFETSKTPRSGTSVLENSGLSHIITDITTAFKGLEVASPLFHAVKLIENDDIEINAHPKLVNIVDEFKKTYNDAIFGNDLEAVVANERYEYITGHYIKAKTHAVKPENFELTKSDKIDKVLTNKWAGIPIFLIILFAIFHLTFSEDLFYLGGLLNLSPSFEGSIFEGLLWTEAGINSPGIILFNLVDNVTGWFSDVVSGWIESLNAEAWVSGLVCDGVLGGVFGVLSFVPQILILFLFFSILEDSGYMARVAFILDKLFRRFGLSGRAFMPMFMGFGCSVPAMINTRTLSEEQEKIATIRVIPFFSCGAKLPILTAIAGAICTMIGLSNADIITYSMYLIGIITAVVAVLIMRHTTMKGDTAPFIMELPTYHRPKFSSLMVHLWDKLKHYVEKAFTIILASTIVIWFLTNFGWNWQMVETMDESILASVGSFFQPLFTPLGFGSQLQSFGWVFVVAAVTGLIAKENVIATFGTLAACIVSIVIANPQAYGNLLSPELIEQILALGEGSEDGIVEVNAMVAATGITVPALLAFIAFNMTTIPCFAAVATARGELTKKQFRGTMLFWLATSYIVSCMIYLVGSWWWTAFIFAGCFVLAGVIIKFYNQKSNVKRV